jgi:hypothetical protein
MSSQPPAHPSIRNLFIFCAIWKISGRIPFQGFFIYLWVQVDVSGMIGDENSWRNDLIVTKRDVASADIPSKACAKKLESNAISETKMYHRKFGFPSITRNIWKLFCKRSVGLGRVFLRHTCDLISNSTRPLWIDGQVHQYPSDVYSAV